MDRINESAAEPIHRVLPAERQVRMEQGDRTIEAHYARDVIRVASSADAARVRTCAADDCDRLFIQAHGRRLWCSAACGNRVRVRRHAARPRAEMA